MKLLFLVHRVPYPPNKGDKIRALWEIKSLAPDHEIDLLCFYDHEEDRHSIEALRPYCRQCHAEGLSWWRARLQALAAALRGRSFSLAYFYSPRMERRVKAALAERRYDAVLVYSSSMAQYVEGRDGLPRVLDMVDVDSDKWAQYAAGSPFFPLRRLRAQEARLLGEYECRMAREFSRTLLCTGAEADILRRRAAGAPIDVLQHIVDTDYFDPGKTEIPAAIARLRPYVIFTGSMDYAPNVEAVRWFHQKALPLMRKQIPDLKFVVAGRNPAQGVLDLARDPAVHVTGSVPDVRPYLRGAAAAVAPMLLARGVQNKILESMAMGLPVAASSRAAVAFPPELARLILVEDDPATLASKLVELIQTGPKAPVAGIRQSLVEVFGDSSLKGKLEEILREAVGQKSGPPSHAEEGVPAGARTPTH